MKISAEHAESVEMIQYTVSLCEHHLCGASVIAHFHSSPMKRELDIELENRSSFVVS